MLTELISSVRLQHGLVESGYYFSTRACPCSRMLCSDRCLTAVGAPVVLARNYAGYASLGRPREGRWGIGDKEEMPFKMASAFLKDRHDVCVPVELLAGLIDEDRWACGGARAYRR